VRPARPDDADALLSWRNDPTTRTNSFDERPIDRDRHLAWLRGRLADPRTRIYVGLADGIECGTVRFEPRNEGLAEVSITLDPRFRGKGLAAELLRVGLQNYRDECGPSRVIARVKAGNIASLRAFERAGYRRVRSAADLVELAID